MTTNNKLNNVTVITSGSLAKSGGIQTVTRTLFESVMPILYLDKEGEDNVKNKLKDSNSILFSGFDDQFVNLANWAKEEGKKVAVFWHFACASEVDPDLGAAWRSLLPLLCGGKIDLFVTCKYGQPEIVEKLFGVKTFLILNNSLENSYKDEPKNGIGIFSGSSDYWVKNLRPNLYASLMTEKQVDIVPYEDSIRNMVKTMGVEDRVTGESRLEHSLFLKRMASCELVTYVTFAEGAPILPLEALNNGVICLTGDNHNYFTDDQRLRDFLVCTRPDDPYAIYRAIEIALENKDEILHRYYRWKMRYDEEQKQNFNLFIEALKNM